LVFTNPRTHVDTARPAARVILSDAIDHFAANLQQFQPIMDQQDIKAIIKALTNPDATPVAPEPTFEEPIPPSPAAPLRMEGELDSSSFTDWESELAMDPVSDQELEMELGLLDTFDEEETSMFGAEPAPSQSSGLKLPSFLQGISLSRRQLLILVGLIVAEVLLVGVFVVLIVINTGLG
jgi:hypothetical protein